MSYSYEYTQEDIEMLIRYYKRQRDYLYKQIDDIDIKIEGLCDMLADKKAEVNDE